MEQYVQAYDGEARLASSSSHKHGCIFEDAPRFCYAFCAHGVRVFASLSYEFVCKAAIHMQPCSRMVIQTVAAKLLNSMSCFKLFCSLRFAS
jgi:hypothetical protein